MTEETLVKELEKALTLPDDKLFGTDPKDKFRELTKTYHPDKWNKSPFHSKVSQLFTDLSNRVSNFGKSLGNVSFNGNSYELEKLVATGDFSSVYLSSKGTLLIKVSHGAPFNKFLKNEVVVINDILQKTKDLKKNMTLYLPKPIQTFDIKDGEIKTVSIFDMKSGHRDECVPMSRVRELYPTGIPVADAAWMMRRMLEFLETIDGLGYVHGAITPSHLLLGDEGHNVIFIGWTHSVKGGQIITSADPQYKSFLPPEIKNKQKVSYNTDLYMASECFKYLVGEELNDPKFKHIKTLIASCQIGMSGRPGARFIYDMFSKHLKDLFGAPKYRYLKLRE